MINSIADLRFDRLVLPRVDVVDDEKLEKIEKATDKAGEQPYQGERTRIFRDRDLNCGIFDEADFRRVDISGSRMSGASLIRTQLQGASLDRAELQDAALREAFLHHASLNSAKLQGATLVGAELQGASLDRAQLQGAWLDNVNMQNTSLYDVNLQNAVLLGANLQGASFTGAQLQGASLGRAQLQGTSLGRAQLQGAYLTGARLQGAYLAGARLRGATLVGAELQGAYLVDAHLQGASLDRAQLQGATLVGAQLQGASLKESRLALALLSKAFLWRAKDAECTDARTIDPRFDPSLAIEGFIEQVVADLNDRKKIEVRNRLHNGLVADIEKNELAVIEKGWRDCVAAAAKVPKAEYDQKHAEFLSDLVCKATDNRKEIAAGIIRNWISDAAERREFSTRLARGLLSPDGNDCPATKDLGDPDKERLRAFASEPASPN